MRSSAAYAGVLMSGVYRKAIVCRGTIHGVSVTFYLVCRPCDSCVSVILRCALTRHVVHRANQGFTTVRMSGYLIRCQRNCLRSACAPCGMICTCRQQERILYPLPRAAEEISGVGGVYAHVDVADREYTAVAPGKSVVPKVVDSSVRVSPRVQIYVRHQLTSYTTLSFLMYSVTGYTVPFFTMNAFSTCLTVSPSW